MDLKGQKIFLTGASGFIGFRLAQCFSKTYGAAVHALVHRYGTVGAARLARLGKIKIFGGDLRETKILTEAMHGCTAVIHCAFGTSGSLQEQTAVTRDGTRQVMELAAKAGVQRVVYFSTAAVLESQTPYAIMKQQAEEIVAEVGQRAKIPFVILRPTCVWGPFSPNWTLPAADFIRSGIAFLPNGGSGKANVVFIDNLVDAVVLALTHPKAAGKTIVINDDTPTTWKDLYEGYAKELGMHFPLSPESQDKNQISGRKILSHWLNQGISQMRRTLRQAPLARQLWFSTPDRLKRSIQQWGAISQELQDLYSTPNRISNQMAKQVLGWRSRADFPTALQMTGDFLRYYYGLPQQ